MPDDKNVCTLAALAELGVVDAHAVPVLVSTFPDVPGATAIAAVPATVNDVPPTATLPLASMTIFVIDPDG